MSVAITQIATPNAAQTEFPFGPFKSRWIDVTFDSTYPAAGEIITAATLGWSAIFGGIIINQPAPSALTSAMMSRIVPNTAQTQVKIQLFAAGYPVDRFHRQILASAQAVDLNSYVAVAPFAGNITAVTYTPVSTLTGADTDSRTLTLHNVTANKDAATKAYTNGVNATTDLANALTVSGTAGNVAVAAGDVLQFQSVHVGAGLADPGGLVAVTITPTIVTNALKELALADASTLTGRYMLIGN